MTDTNSAKGVRAQRGHPAHPILRIWIWIVDGLAVIGTVMIGALMAIICADIVFRNLLGSSLPLVSELGALMLVMIVYLQLGATIRAGRLARTEIFLPLLKRKHPRAGRIVSGTFDLIGAGMLGLMAWSTLSIVERDFTSGEFIGVTGIATMVTWPFRVLILIGVSVAAIECIVQAYHAAHDTKNENPT